MTSFARQQMDIPMLRSVLLPTTGTQSRGNSELSQRRVLASTHPLQMILRFLCRIPFLVYQINCFEENPYILKSTRIFINWRKKNGWLPIFWCLKRSLRIPERQPSYFCFILPWYSRKRDESRIVVDAVVIKHHHPNYSKASMWERCGDDDSLTSRRNEVQIPKPKPTPLQRNIIKTKERKNPHVSDKSSKSIAFLRSLRVSFGIKVAEDVPRIWRSRFRRNAMNGKGWIHITWAPLPTTSLHFLILTQNKQSLFWLILDSF